jgi:hypothetical protein
MHMHTPDLLLWLPLRGADMYAYPLSHPCTKPCAPQDVRKAQSLGFALDSGISLEVVDVTKPVE